MALLDNLPFQETVHHRSLDIQKVEKDMETKYPVFQKSENLFPKEYLLPNEINSIGRDKYKCPFCEYNNFDIFMVQGHVSHHKGCNSSACFVCGKVFGRKPNLKRHLFIHTGEKPFSCTKCDFVCAEKANLQKHGRIHSNEKPFLCDICGYKTRYKQSIDKHKEIVHLGIKSFSCPQCDKTYGHSSHLRDHVSAVHLGEKPYSCGECDYSCHSKNDLKRHMNKHTGVKNCVCPICGFRAADKKYISNHMKRLHAAEPEKHLCSVCGNSFSTKGGLKTHSLIHTDEKPFSCPNCAYKCRQSGSLKTHMMTHMGEVTIFRQKPDLPSTETMASNDIGYRTFSCDICNHHYNTEDELQTHNLIHKSTGNSGDIDLNNTTQSGEKLHSCSFCDYACKQKGSLKRHVILKHHDEIYPF